MRPSAFLTIAAICLTAGFLMTARSPLLARTVTATPAAPKTVPMDPVVIAVPGDALLKKPRVRFAHARHMTLDGREFTCAACHHERPGSGSVKRCTEAECHARPAPDGPLGKKDPVYFRNAFHAKSPLSCNGCHGRRRAQNLSHGPTSCGGCHRTG